MKTSKKLLAPEKFFRSLGLEIYGFSKKRRYVIQFRKFSSDFAMLPISLLHKWLWKASWKMWESTML